jgi:stage IV sporulation protein FB
MKQKTNKKFKISISFVLLFIVCALMQNVVLLINYLLALTLHELAHLYIATRYGYALKQLKFSAFGVSVELDEQVENQDIFAINIAGPLMNLMLCVTCLAICFIIPHAYQYLSMFCLSNIILAVFNLVPVYPLDGGKIFRGIIKSDKAYKTLNCLIRILLAFVFIFAFVLSCYNGVNFLLLVLAMFFLTSKSEKTPTMSIFKYRKNKHFDKVIILKVDENETLFSLIKQIKSYYYTIFYIPQINKFFDEDCIIELSLNNTLTTRIKEFQ